MELIWSTYLKEKKSQSWRTALSSKQSSLIIRKVFPLTLKCSRNSSWDLRSSVFEAAPTTRQQNAGISLGWVCNWWSDVLRFPSSKPGQEISLVQLQTPRCEIEIIINSSVLPLWHSYLHVYSFLARAMLQVYCTLHTVRMMEEREKRVPKRTFPQKNPTQSFVVSVHHWVEAFIDLLPY